MCSFCCKLLKCFLLQTCKQAESLFSSFVLSLFAMQAPRCPSGRMATVSRRWQVVWQEGQAGIPDQNSALSWHLGSDHWPGLPISVQGCTQRLHRFHVNGQHSLVMVGCDPSSYWIDRFVHHHNSRSRLCAQHHQRQ